MADKIIPTALKIWLAFLLLLWILGYSVVTSIVFGAIGGLAGGMVSAWWVTRGGEPTTTTLPEPIQRFGRRLQEGRSFVPSIPFFSRKQRRITRSKR